MPEFSPAQLRTKCRRGMLELDIILQRFLQNGYLQTTDEEKEQFLSLLELQDPVLNELITGMSKAPEELKSLMSKIHL